RVGDQPRLRPRRSDEDRHRRQRAGPQHRDLRRGRHRPLPGPQRRTAPGAAPHLRGHGAGHRRPAARAQGRLLHGHRPRPRSQRGQAPHERIRDPLHAGPGYARRRHALEVGRMLDGQTTLVPVVDESQVGEARRAMAALGQRVGLDPNAASNAAVVTTEAATNLVKHAGGGEVLLRAVEDGVEVIALDRGPGMADVSASLRDGHSTVGTQGNGLGAIRRMATTFDIYSVRGQGTAVLARIRSQPAPRERVRLELGAVSLPKSGETVNGDAWLFQTTARGARILMVDGLGHGPIASDAAHAALEAFRAAPGESVEAAVETCHLALRSTRGAALAVTEVDVEAGVVRFAGVGNIAGAVWNGSQSHHTVSHNGTAGHGTIRIREFSYPWPKGALLVLASDGLATRWTLESYPGLAARDPALVAAILYRDHSRQRDDITVVVAREPRA